MNSKNVFKILLINVILIGFSSCKEEKRVIEKIDFKTDYKLSSEIENKIEKSNNPYKHQFAAADYAKKGDYKNALIQYDLAMRVRETNYTKSKKDSINGKYKTVKASDFIIQKAKEHQVVIINEAHHNSLHRVFIKSLLQELFDNGYKNLGLEALSTGAYKDSLLNKRKYPVQKTGHYIKDPQFGNLVREALEIGYNLFPYDQTSGSNNKEREIEQARNIEKLIIQNPEEKILIHCGFDHVLEGEHRSWEKAMAARLAEYTGIDPLTINQVFYSEKSKPKYNHPFLKALDIKESSVIIDKNNNPHRYKRGNSWADIAVFHPNTIYIDGRPNWIFQNENKKVSIELNDIRIESPVMILAFRKSEDINTSIPVDIIEVKNNIKNCILSLKQGDYNIVVTNGKESVKFEQNVK